MHTNFTHYQIVATITLNNIIPPSRPETERLINNKGKSKTETTDNLSLFRAKQRPCESFLFSAPEQIF